MQNPCILLSQHTGRGKDMRLILCLVMLIPLMPGDLLPIYLGITNERSMLFIFMCAGKTVNNTTFPTQKCDV